MRNGGMSVREVAGIFVRNDDDHETRHQKKENQSKARIDAAGGAKTLYVTLK